MAGPSSAWVLLPVAALLLAGCAQPPAASTGTAAAHSTASATAAPAGSVSAAPGAERAFPIDFQGHLSNSFCAPSGPGTCTFSTLPSQAAQQDAKLLEWTGAATWNGTLGLIWQAATPATQTLEITVQPYKTCGSGCWQTFGEAQRAEGASPLALTVAGLRAPADAEALQIYVHAPFQNHPPVFAQVQTDQDFQLAGTLSARAA